MVCLSTKMPLGYATPHWETTLSARVHGGIGGGRELANPKISY
jgi:hypothetical protein